MDAEVGPTQKAASLVQKCMVFLHEGIIVEYVQRAYVSSVQIRKRRTEDVLRAQKVKRK